MYQVKQKDLVGDIKGFPVEVVQKMIERQVEQNNVPDVKVFQEDRYCYIDEGGFSWSDTEEGNVFWTEVIGSRIFDLFFEKYPKQKLIPPTEIKWENQHCGVIQGECSDVLKLMPDLKGLLETFPDNPEDYIWDVKVHMLFPNQFPCIPNWHRDMIPRDENMKEDESKITPEYPMYLWLSGAPLTKFRNEEGKEFEVVPQEWFKFTQLDWHCGQPSTEFVWRGLVRACHKKLGISNKNVNNPFGRKEVLRRHTQVYLDANNFKW